jgi:Holliday junction DNA helicase RuvA
MYDYIIGKIIRKEPTHTVIENNGIGYMVHITVHTYSALQNKDEIKLYTYYYVREDTRTMYGFITQEERTTFELFIAISGIGPNTARLVLSSMTPAQVVEAVESEDVHAFKSVKGIGAKTAERILIDLRDKISKIREELSDPSMLSPASTAEQNDIKEVRQALLTLGFPPAKIQHALARIKEEKTGDTVENMIKQALKSMS